MIDVEQRTGHFYDTFAGTENDLNHVLSTLFDSEHEITIFWNSRFVDLSEVQSMFQNNPIQFLILHWIYKARTQSLTFNFPLLKTLRRKVYSLEQSVCKRHGLAMIPACHYYSSLDTNLFTGEANALNTVG